MNDKSASTPTRRQRGAQRRRRPTSLGTCWDTIEIAAAKLDLDPQALRARCRRAARNENGETVARLGMGVVARKFGTSWRLFVPSAEGIAGAV